MPSREEIATEFRDAANIVMIPIDKEHFLRIAAQVSAMRCETCLWYGDNQQCGRHNGYLFADDGCFHHEQKPAG